MSDPRHSEDSKPSDLCSLLIWLTCPLRPVLAAVGCAGGIILSAISLRRNSAGRSDFRKLFVCGLILGSIIAFLTIIRTLGYHLLEEIDDWTILMWLWSRTGRIATIPISVLEMPALWVGVGGGFIMKNALQTPGHFLHSFLTAPGSNIDKWTRCLAVLLLLSMICNAWEFLGRLAGIVAGWTIFYGSEHPWFIAYLFSFGLSGVHTFGETSNRFLPLDYVILHATTHHLSRLLDTWACGALIAFLTLRLPSTGVALIVSFVLLVAISCIGGDDPTGFAAFTFQIPLANSVRNGLSELIAGSISVHSEAMLLLIKRAEAALLAIVLLGILSALSHRHFSEAP